jgi:hypothetical protein
VTVPAPVWPYDEAAETIADLSYHLPKKVFRL